MGDNLDFIDPTLEIGKVKLAMAPRAKELSGKVVALLDNTKEQADLILETVGKALRERYGVARVIIRRKEMFSKPATEALINEMAREAQVAVAALGG
jgi:hypothetical protein